MSLQKSRIYTFLDESKKFSINFFDAQKFIQDAIAIQKLPQQTINFFIDSLLSYPTLLSFTKPGEEFALYLDSSKPYFLYKFESYQLKARTLLLPDTLDSYPDKIKGICRLQKHSPGSSQPYTSLLEINDESPSEILKKIFSQSYQVDAAFYLSPNKNQSIMIYRIPDTGGIGLSNHSNTKFDFDPDKNESLSFLQKHKTSFDSICKSNFNELLPIVRGLENLGFDYLVSRVIDFSCRCSKEVFVDRISTFGIDEIKLMFSDTPSISITCDYCRTHYEITKDSFPELVQH